MLFETGLTPKRLEPAQFQDVIGYGIGLTDVVKTASGSDASLPSQSFDPDRLRTRILELKPGILAFNGKPLGANRSLMCRRSNTGRRPRNLAVPRFSCFLRHPALHEGSGSRATGTNSRNAFAAKRNDDIEQHDGGAKMKAILCTEWGGPEKLSVGEAEPPSPGAGEVVIDVKAAGVNFADTVIIQGTYQLNPTSPSHPASRSPAPSPSLGTGSTMSRLATGWWHSQHRCLCRASRRQGAGNGPNPGRDGFRNRRLFRRCLFDVAYGAGLSGGPQRRARRC